MKNNYKVIQLKWILILVLGVVNLSVAQKKVIAYIPNWVDLNAFSSSVQYSKLTHINIAFENPDANGYLSFNSGSNTIINAAHAQNVKVFVSLGGGSVSEGGAIRDNYFNLIKAANRTAFIQKIYDYLVAHNFDGVDMDLEGPAINSDYGGFVIALAAKLHANGKLISAALSEGYGGANVPASTFAAFDWINIMAYDATGPWQPGNPGQHSPYSMAVNQFNYWTGRGLPASKAIIGLPFYGYGFGASANQGISYANIVTQYPGAENLDQVGNTIYYNGIPTIKAKTTFAIQNAGGVMIWELSQDATGAKSLLTAVNQVITGSQPPTGTGTLIQAESYSSMSGIQTEATTDTGGGLNVGYADTGDWMAYSNVNFPTSGSYVIEYRVASAVNGARISSDLNAGSIQLGNVNIPNTGGWQNWQTVSQTVNVNAGTYNFGIFIQSSGVNINWFRITKSGAGLAAKSAASEEFVALNIYPTSVDSTLSITQDVSNANVSIIDSQTGAVVSGSKVNNNSIDVSLLKSGIYLIVFEKEGTQTVRRFIKK